MEEMAMKRMTSVICLVALGVTVTSMLLAQERGRYQNPVSNQPVFEPTKQPSSFPVAPTTSNRSVDNPRQYIGQPTRLSNAPNTNVYRDPRNGQRQTTFAEISRKLGSLLDADELEVAIQDANERITELLARRKLQSAMQALNEVLKEFPKSEAAKEAAKLLDRATHDDESSGGTATNTDAEKPVFGVGVNSDAGVTGTIQLDIEDKKDD